MTDKEIIRVATEFRKGMLGKRSSEMMCAAVSWPLAGLLKFYGVSCKCVESDLGEMNHIWIQLSDGRCLDPTCDQFNHLFNYDYPPVYLGEPMGIHAI